MDMQRPGSMPVTTEPPGLAYADPANPELATIGQAQQHITAASTPQIGYAPTPVAQEHPLSGAVLILGLLGFVTFITAPIAWIMGANAMREVRKTPQMYAENQSRLRAGIVLGQMATMMGLLCALGIFFGLYGYF
ncbi:MAG: hypothetical protein ACRCWS_06625 [Propionibacteriaceae bacterium]